MAAEPVQNFGGVFVRRKDGVENVFDSSVPNDQRQALQEAYAIHFECRQPQGVAEPLLGVTQNREGQAQAMGHLALVGCGLCAAAEYVCLELRQLLKMIAE